ncbi:mRNA surveillance protein pelota [Candidatus Woesearchaeota archaeon]|nr:MAG: mRNA surveillance protein pelota [Candidatus Woesearchaeota archaeon]
MKILEKNLRQGEVKVLVEVPEDVWFLGQLIDKGDIVKGKTLRKLKVTEEADPIKRAVYMAIQVEKVEFAGDSLRVNGTMREGPEDVPRGSYHTFSVEVGTTVSIVKEKWFGFQLQRLEEACEQSKARVLVVVFDREEAFIGRLRASKIELLAHLAGEVQKKHNGVVAKGDFFAELARQVEQYDARLKCDAVVLASPAFWKEELLKVIKSDALRKKIVQATCSSVDESAFDEVLKSDSVRAALSRERVAKELHAVDRVLAEIAKKGAVAYGFAQVKTAADAGAIRELLVTDSLIAKRRLDRTFAAVDQVLRAVDAQKGDIVIVSGDHQGGKRLDGLGGMAALLRYKIE